VSTSEQTLLKFLKCLFPDYKLPFDFKSVSTEHPEWVRTLKLLLFKKYERSEYIINAFDLAFAFETTRAKRVP
jgi:hypothetical protein